MCVDTKFNTGSKIPCFQRKLTLNTFVSVQNLEKFLKISFHMILNRRDSVTKQIYIFSFES